MSDARYWMQTYTCRPFKFDHPYNLELDIKDIARPLSRLPRFCGHTTKMLSVAEHSVAVSYILRDQGTSSLVQMHGLMHDAHEAFTGDIPAPFLRFLNGQYGCDIKMLQAEYQMNIYAAFDIPLLSSTGENDLIRSADIMACKIERDLYMESALQWDIDGVDYPRDYCDFYHKRPIGAGDAMGEFIRRYKELRAQLQESANA